MKGLVLCLLIIASLVFISCEVNNPSNPSNTELTYPAIVYSCLGDKKCMMHSDGVLPYFNDGIYAVTELDLDDAYAIVKVDFEKAAFESLTPQIEDNFIFDARIYCHLINEVTKEVE